ncbi:MAG: ATP-binding protein [Minwuia sp.]|nr:ATP-binding protein [Minwuia sp.]
MRAQKLNRAFNGFIDSWIPSRLINDRNSAQRVRMFVISHTLGPFLGQTITLALLLLDPEPTPHVYVLAGSITLFCIFPPALKLTSRYFDAHLCYSVLALLSVMNLIFAVLWGSYHYAGISSPFLVWLLVVPLLAFFYLGSNPVARNFVFGMTGSGLVVFYLLYQFGGGFPEHVESSALVPIGIISIICAMAYVTMMAVYYASVVDSQSELLAEIERHQSTTTQLLDAKEEAERANGAKSDFLAKMSHELRTPLNAVIGYSEMLLEDAEIDGRGEDSADLKKINSAGKHLLALVSEVLDLSKIEAGKMELYTEEVDLDSFVSEVASTCRQIIAKNANELVIRRSSDLGRLECDATKLRQALLNLLSNAAKFTENGRVILSARRERIDNRDWVKIEVQDTGIGIAPDQISNLFHNFSQATPSISSKFGGTGLGLSLSQKLCRFMGGDITVESTIGVGTTFTIILPATTRALASVSSPSQETVSQVPADTSARITPLEPAARNGQDGPMQTILVIDPDPSALEIMERSLQKESYRVVTTERAKDGLQIAHTLKPDAIILDVAVGDMDGWEALDALSSHDDTAGIPVIVQSIIDDPRKGYQLGASAFLVKPVDREPLLETISQVCDEAGFPGNEVLVIDDDGTASRSTVAAAREAGWHVTMVPDFGIGLTRAHQVQPDLVIVDSDSISAGLVAFVDGLKDLEGISILVLVGSEAAPTSTLAIPGTAKTIFNATDRDDVRASALAMLTRNEDLHAGPYKKEAAHG